VPLATDPFVPVVQPKSPFLDVNDCDETPCRKKIQVATVRMDRFSREYPVHEGSFFLDLIIRTKFSS
jgi:hypothetical protein